MTRSEIHARFLTIRQRAEERVEADLARLRPAAPCGREGVAAHHRAAILSATRQRSSEWWPDIPADQVPSDEALDLAAEQARARFNRRGDEPT